MSRKIIVVFGVPFPQFLRLFAALVGFWFAAFPAFSQDSQDYGIHAYEDLEWLSYYANVGDQNAQVELGVRYYNGKGIVADKQEAIRWFQKAVDSGNDEAQLYLGYMYWTGDGVSKNYFRAARLFKSAAEKGNAAAMFYLGEMCERGEGVPADNLEAFTWYYLAGERAETDQYRSTYEAAVERLGELLTQQQQDDAQKMVQEFNNYFPVKTN